MSEHEGSLRFLRKWYLCFIFLVAPPYAFALFSDRIGAPAEEIWQAARQVLEPHGLHKERVQTRELETEWIEERVVRSSGLLKKIAKRTYRLRYRIRVHLEEETAATRIEVKGSFQQKPLDAPFSARWESARPDRDMEREFFQKILFQMGTNRRKQPA